MSNKLRGSASSFVSAQTLFRALLDGCSPAGDLLELFTGMVIFVESDGAGGIRLDEGGDGARFVRVYGSYWDMSGARRAGNCCWKSCKGLRLLELVPDDVRVEFVYGSGLVWVVARG